MKKGLLAILPVIFAVHALDVEAAGKSYGFNSELNYVGMNFSLGDNFGSADSNYYLGDIGLGSGYMEYSNPIESFVTANSMLSGQFSYDTRSNTAQAVNQAVYGPVDFSLNVESEIGTVGRVGLRSSNANATFAEDLFQRGPFNQFRLSSYGGGGDIQVSGFGGGCEFGCISERFQFSLYNDNNIMSDYSDVFAGIYGVELGVSLVSARNTYYGLEEVGLFQGAYMDDANHSLSPLLTGETDKMGSVQLDFSLDSISRYDSVIEVLGIGTDSFCEGPSCIEHGNEAYENKKLEIEGLLNELGLNADIDVNYNITEMSELPAGGSVLDPVLPDVGSGTGNEFVFTLNVNGDEFTFIDPEVAVGYDYESLEGANFQSVILPAGFGDNIYQLWLFDELLGEFVYSGDDLMGGQAFEFAEGGYDLFRTLGIEVDENLDPNDPEAFVTGLKFISNGDVRMSQSAITQTVVPVPPSILFFMTGIVGLYLRKLV